MRVCLAYDCLYPYTVGGAERWYRNLASEMVSAGHDVTYLTRVQWPEEEPPEIAGVQVIAVSRPDELYVGERRRIGPPLRFGRGVLGHLLRNRTRYDAIHLCAFPYFSLLAARLALSGRRTPMGVDWFEVWSRDYWRGYLGGPAGAIGEAVQRLCAVATPKAFVFSDLHGRRLVEEGLRTDPVRLGGLYAGPLEPHPHAGPRAPLAVFAGRHIPEKQAELIPAAIAAARTEVPELEALILGDGPQRPAVLAAISAAGAEAFVQAPGFVSSDDVEAALGRASCNVLPSSREGYGLVVIEAAALGTPSVVLAGADNSATELIEEGVNGFVASSVEELPGAIARAHAGGEPLRASTAAWFAENAARLSAKESAATIVRTLEAGVAQSGSPSARR